MLQFLVEMLSRAQGVCRGEGYDGVVTVKRVSDPRHCGHVGRACGGEQEGRAHSPMALGEE